MPNEKGPFSVQAIAAGLLADLLGSLILSLAVTLMVGSLSGTAAAGDVLSEALLHSTGVQAVTLLIGLAFNALGGYVAAAKARFVPLKHAGIVGGLSLAAGLVMLATNFASGPIWYAITSAAMILPAALGGGWLFKAAASPTSRNGPWSAPRAIALVFIACFILQCAAVILSSAIGPSAADRPVDIEEIQLAAPVLMTSAELDDALYVLTEFFAIDHDGWLASEASMVKVAIEAAELPAGLDRAGMLALFPVLEKEFGQGGGGSRPFFTLLDQPEVEMMRGGAYLDPAGRRILLLQGEQYTQDGYGGSACYLEGAKTGQVRIDMAFLPGDYGGLENPARYAIRLRGRLTAEGIAIEAAGGRFRARTQVEALLQAARDFDSFARTTGEVARFTLRDEQEARAVEELGRRVAAIEMEEMRRDGRDFVVTERHYDLGLLVAFVRYGRAVFPE